MEHGSAKSSKTTTLSLSAVSKSLVLVAQSLLEIRKTVIDYVACSRELLSQIKSFTVADQVQGYDHAALIVNLEIDIGSSNITFESPRKKRKVDVVLPDDTEVRTQQAIYPDIGGWEG
jgi:hypothetical protein